MSADEISDAQVVALAKAAFEQSRSDIKRNVGDNSTRDLQTQQPGITIDLGHKNIARLPDEVIDVIRLEIERLALSHNLLTSLPRRLIECHRLRYLNVRYNAMREIPDVILQMTSLEILDVSRNKLRSISPKIANLASLKVLAIAKNQVEELPLCLGEINSLAVLKLDGNPLKYPPPEVCTLRSNAPAPTNDNERDAIIATQVKKFMRQEMVKQHEELERSKMESSSDESWTESNPETPRPSRRVNGGRFPVKPSSGTLDGFPENKMESPGMPPPIPNRSHFRVASQTNGASRKSQVAPLVLTNGVTDRNRSNSEGTGSASNRQKRMGIYNNKSTEIGLPEERRRRSHFRGFSQGLVVPGHSASGMSGPATAIGYGDFGTVRSLANRPLSDVREDRRGSYAPDIVVEASKSILYALSQLHDCISHMMRSMKRVARNKEDLRRKEDFHRRFTTTYLSVRALDQVLRRFSTLAEEDEEDAQKLSGSVYQYALRCLDSFLAVSLSIAENRNEITRNADPRILRTFLFLQQSSLVEIRNACQVLGAEFRDSTRTVHTSNSVELAPTIRVQPLKSHRTQSSPSHRIPYQMHPPIVLHSNDNSRSNTMTSMISATPRSGESFSTLATTMTRSNTLNSTFEESEEDVQFEKIYAKLNSACMNCASSIPQIVRLLRITYDNLHRELDSEHPRLKVLAGLIDKSNLVQEMTEPLARRIKDLQVGDSYARGQPEFWQQCMGFMKAWSELAQASTSQGRNMGLLSPEVKQLMKPLHKTVKEATLAINNSPWSHLTSNNNPGLVSSLSSFTSKSQPPKFLGRPAMTMTSGGGAPFPGPINTSVPPASSSAYAQPYSSVSMGSQGSGYATPVPATPLSAALGAAAQATVPNAATTQPAPTGGTINFIERADRYLNQTARRI